MIVNSVSTVGQRRPFGMEKNEHANIWAYSSNNQDRFNKSGMPVSQISFQSGKNYLKVATSLKLKNPLEGIKPALQMRVRGVKRFQDNMDPEFISKHNTFSINRLADSNWADGDPLEFKTCIVKNSEGIDEERINLSSPKFGKIGRVHSEIAPKIIELLKSNPDDFRFELSNIVAGTTKGAPTIGLRVNLLYTGTNPKLEAKAQKAFHDVLNAPEVAEKAFFYQPKTSPDEVLKQILGFEEKENGVEAAKQMETVISNIVREISEAKKILVIGHCKPDGDTIGCSLGLKNSINMVYEDKQVDCAIADEIPGLFRSKLPGIDNEIKQPYSEAKISLLEKELQTAIDGSADKTAIAKLNFDLARAKDKTLHLDPNEKYDLVILMDIPTPTRFSSDFKDYMKNADKTIYIDHHPLKHGEWNSTIDSIGVDMNQIIKNNLAWIAERVPAATEMVTIIASKLNPTKNPLSSANYIKTANSKNVDSRLKAAVASLTAGMMTDTGGFSRTANLLPTDIINKAGKLVPLQNRPNFSPEGLSKWLFSLTDNTINKKWLREEITYDIKDEARELMLEYANKHKIVNDDIGLGAIAATFDEMHEVLNVANNAELAQNDAPITNFLDIQNAFKYSEVMGDLRSSAIEHGTKLGEQPGPYDKDKIAVFVCESEKAGQTAYREIYDEKEMERKVIEIPAEQVKENALRFSFRSQEGTIHAELLASLFSGGGHGGAAGGHIRGKDVTLDSRFVVKVDGKRVTDKEKLYEILQNNYKVMHDKDFSSEDKEMLCSKIELIKDDKGENPLEIINGLVNEIRMKDAQT